MSDRERTDATIRSLFERIRDRHKWGSRSTDRDSYLDAVEAIGILNKAPRIGAEDFKWSDSDRLLADPTPEADPNDGRLGERR